jgi:ArsR family transcriptional regulator
MAKLSRDIQDLAQTLRILGDPNRLRIVLTLKKQERNVTQLCKKLRMPQPSVSRHLGILRMSGLVQNRRQGKEIYYSLANFQRMKHGRALWTLLNSAAKSTS